MNYSAQIMAEYPEVINCFELEKQINLLRYDIDYYRKRFKSSEANPRESLLKEKEELFFVLNCPEIVEAKKQLDVKQIFDKYANEAKNRITPDSVKTRNYLIAISSSFIIIAAIILYKRKN